MTPQQRSARGGSKALAAVADQAQGCRNCELWEDATQTVFGEGPVSATHILVGEQPGDVEDREGRPFVGPAGKLLERAMADAGIDRDNAYVTNAVKHFRFRTSGPRKRRIHEKPDLSHMVACLPWLQSEMSLVAAPTLVVLGATAARVLLGPSFRVSKSRGQSLEWHEVADERWAEIPTAVERVVATVHPSSVLRAQDRKGAFDALVSDLTVAAN
ncbi:MAG TPA: UdgX family uracil-DNA binding protein [Actinomycetes bacterium]|nr:UdgX family uracil-DNA binding protein [Actinomycetes bacterium]